MRFIYHLVYRNYRVTSGLWFWVRRRFTPAGLTLLGAALLAGSTGVDVERTVTYQAFSVSAALLLVSVLGGWRWRARFTARRWLPRVGSVGEPLKYRVQITNTGTRPFPGLQLLEDLADPRPTRAEWVEYQQAQNRRSRPFRVAAGRAHHPFRRVQLSEGTVPPLPPRAATEVVMEILPLRRGVLRFAGVTLARPDALGLFRALRSVPAPETVLILPRRYPVPALRLPGSLRYQPGGVVLAANVGHSEEFVTLRDYRPGDPLRHIHWRSWARAGRPIVKEFADEFFVRHALVLDTFTADAFLPELEEAVSVAASFACTVLTQESLLDLLFVGAQSYCFTAGRGLAQADQILEVLAAVGPCAERPFANLEQLVLRHAGRISGCICVLLAWDEPRRHLVRQLRQAGVPVLVLVVVPAGQSLPTPGEDAPEGFHVLETGKIAAQLATLT